jgi:hypothetical protein
LLGFAWYCMHNIALSNANHMDHCYISPPH